MPGVMMRSGSISPGCQQMLDLGDGHLARCRHDRIEVSRGLAVDEVAFGVALERMHDRKVGDETALHHVAGPVELALVLAFRDLSAGAGSGEEGGDAGAAGANALRQRALRVELDLELAGEILLREGLVLPDIGGDHFLDLPGVEQNAETLAVHAAIVGDDGEVLDPRIADGEDQRFRNAAQAETTGHDRHPVPEQPGQRGARVRMDLVHDRSISPRKLSARHNRADGKVNSARCRP